MVEVLEECIQPTSPLACAAMRVATHVLTPRRHTCACALLSPLPMSDEPPCPVNMGCSTVGFVTFSSRSKCPCNLFPNERPPTCLVTCVCLCAGTLFAPPRLPLANMWVRPLGLQLSGGLVLCMLSTFLRRSALRHTRDRIPPAKEPGELHYPAWVFLYAGRFFLGFVTRGGGRAELIPARGKVFSAKNIF